MNKTNIEYLTHTWNPIIMRCTKISPACANCWHLRKADMFSMNPMIPPAHRHIYAGTDPRPLLIKERLEKPLRRKKLAIIGVQFMGDLFHPSIPFEWIDEIFDVMIESKHTFLILTKRPQKILEYHNYVKYENSGYTDEGKRDVSSWEWPNNILTGLTVCNQSEYDEKIPIFTQVPGSKWLSLEPLLGYIDLTPPQYRGTNLNQDLWIQELSGIVLGGETGAGARPIHPNWARAIRDRCVNRTDMGRPWPLPFLFKQWGVWAERQPPIEDLQTPNHKGLWIFDCGFSRLFEKPCADAVWVEPVGKKASGRLLDGREWNEMPGVDK